MKRRELSEEALKEWELIERYQSNKDVDAYKELLSKYEDTIIKITAYHKLKAFFTQYEISNMATEIFKDIISKIDLRDKHNIILSTYITMALTHLLMKEYYTKGGELNNISTDKFMRQEMQNKSAMPVNSEALKLFKINASMYGHTTHDYMQIEYNADKVIDSIIEHCDNKEGLYKIDRGVEEEKIKNGLKDIFEFTQEMNNGAYWIKDRGDCLILKIPRDHVEYKVSEVVFRDYDIIIKRKELNK